MQLSLTKLPWWGQIGAFVVVSALAVFGFWKFYVAEIAADIQMRKTRLTALRADVAKGQATARQLPQFQSQVSELENRLENLRQILPEQDAARDAEQAGRLAVIDHLQRSAVAGRTTGQRGGELQLALLIGSGGVAPASRDRAISAHVHSL